MSRGPRTHGVLITYRRPDALREFFRVLDQQTITLDTLVVVDNDNDPVVADLVTRTGGTGSPAREISYLACAENMGPAGGIHAGIDAVLSHAGRDDWIVLLDDDDPPLRDDCLETMHALLAELTRHDPHTAAIGLWGASLNKWTGRVRAVGGSTPEMVDYLPGSALPHYSVQALRVTGAPDPEMFFGFDDLELGLRLRDGGFTLYSSGLARQHGLAHMVEGRKAAIRAEPPTWRRYYSLRNIIVVLRSHGATRGAIYRSVTGGLAKPIANMARNPRVGWASLVANVRAIRDGWGGRLGKTIDPAGLPAVRRNAAPR